MQPGSERALASWSVDVPSCGERASPPGHKAVWAAMEEGMVPSCDGRGNGALLPLEPGLQGVGGVPGGFCGWRRALALWPWMCPRARTQECGRESNGRRPAGAGRLVGLDLVLPPGLAGLPRMGIWVVVGSVDVGAATLPRLPGVVSLGRGIAGAAAVTVNVCRVEWVLPGQGYVVGCGVFLPSCSAAPW